jgi:ABC-type multidrug transport system ATPase subunit
MSDIWQLENVDAGFGSTQTKLSNLSFQIRGGERVAIFSEDGPKSRGLLLRLLAGLRPHRSGSLCILGETIKLRPFWADWDRSVPNSVRRRLGVCLEDEGLLSNVSLREGLELLFRFKYGDHTEKPAEASQRIVQSTCDRFGLSQVMELRPNAMTREERRLAGLARAFLSKPYVLVLENPSWGVSDANYARVFAAIEFLLSSVERTLLVATDDWILVRAFCKRVLVLKNSELSFDGTPVDYLKSHPEFLTRLKKLNALKSAWLDSEGAA